MVQRGCGTCPEPQKLNRIPGLQSTTDVLRCARDARPKIEEQGSMAMRKKTNTAAKRKAAAKKPAATKARAAPARKAAARKGASASRRTPTATAKKTSAKKPTKKTTAKRLGRGLTGAA